MPTPHRSPSRPIAALLAAGLLLLGACGSGGGDSATTTTEAARTTTSTAPDDTGGEETASSTTDTATSTDPVTITTDGSTTGPVDEGRYQSDLATAIWESFKGDELSDEERARCIAGKWIETIGLDDIQDAEATGLGNGEIDEWAKLTITDDQGEQLFGAFTDCGVRMEYVFRQQISDGQDPAIVECVEEKLTDGFVKELMIGNFQGDDMGDKLTDELSKCGPNSGG